MSTFYNPFATPKPPTPEQKRKEMLDDAKLKLIEHEAAAEYSAAMATMLRARIMRLEAQSRPLAPVPVPTMESLKCPPP